MSSFVTFYSPTGHALLKETTLSSFVTLFSYWACFIKGALLLLYYPTGHALLKDTTLSSFVLLGMLY